MLSECAMTSWTSRAMRLRSSATACAASSSCICCCSTSSPCWMRMRYPTNHPMPTNARYSTGVSSLCSAAAQTSKAVAEAAASTPPRVEVIALTTPTSRMRSNGAKSPVIGVDVANSRMPVPNIHADQRAMPSCFMRSNAKNTSHGLAAITIAIAATGQSESGRWAMAIAPITTMVTSIVTTCVHPNPEGITRSLRSAHARRWHMSAARMRPS